MPIVASLPASMVRIGVAIALLYEGLAGARRVSRIVVFFALYDATVFLMAGLRAVVIALQVAAVVMLFGRRPAGAAFGASALWSSAVLILLEIGLGLSPSSVPPGQRWPMVILYWGYAALASWLLRRTSTAR